jgi:transcriptional regulator with GAF, ATPase, and Fis domain
MTGTELLLEVWREVSRHLELSESIHQIAQLIAPQVPADYIVVRRIDLTRRGLETVAVGRCRANAAPVAMAPSDCSAAAMRTLLTKGRERGVIDGLVPGVNEVITTAAPPGFRGACVMGPIVPETGPMGVVLLLSHDRRFTEAHRTLLGHLLEPIGVALANTARVHELQRLREALEADKRTLLTKLGRHDVADAIVGAETGLRGVISQIDQVAATEVPVLILGETGSGKEVLARSLHDRSQRRQSPFVRVNCETIPSRIVEAELFGEERDGSKGMRAGWFERADGGTLFLDEVAELPLDIQAKLVTFLQEGTIVRVGGRAPVPLDVRIVGATHRDLRDMVGQGRFREDLWFQLSVFPIQLPPLRDRREDIPRLAAHFASRAGIRLTGVPLTPTATEIESLLAYHWPGNVRELAAVIERAAILGRGQRLQIDAALGSAGDAQAASGGASPAQTSRDDDASLLTLDDEMRRQIEAALARARGRIEGSRGAAATLGINPHTLRARMRKLKIDWRQFRRGERTGAASIEPPQSLDRAMTAHIRSALQLTGGRVEGPNGAARKLAINPHTLRARMRKLGISPDQFRGARNVPV